MSETSQGKELRLETRNGVFGGLHWENDGAPRILCLHGWLDNAGSFLPLAPLLHEYDVVALDLAGHGHSDHRPAGTRYYMMDNLWDVDAVLDELDWQDGTLIGHSLGGVVASAYAVAAPERVSRLVTLDGLGALSEPASLTAGRLKKSMASVRKESAGLKDYPDIESAARVRQKATGIPLEVARLLCGRALTKHGNGYRWCTDPGLNWHSPSRLTEEQVQHILAAITAPTLSVSSDEIESMIDRETAENRRKVIQNFTFHRLQGHHHFHMDQAEIVAPLIIEFLRD